MFEGNDLGFVMPNGDKYLRQQEGQGHIEIAREIIEKERLTLRFKKSVWDDPVDFLIFEEGVLKIGSRYGERVISYYPNLLTKKVRDAILEYRNRMYREDKVQPPADAGGFKYFHL